MSRIRFATAREVFEAFPGVRADIGAPPTEDAPLTFMRALLESATPEDALSFCAYVLPRREAVWWACQCVRTLVPEPGPDGETALRAAEAWVREPDEPRRRTALAIGTKANPRAAQSWVALAAAWSAQVSRWQEAWAAVAPEGVSVSRDERGEAGEPIPRVIVRFGPGAPIDRDGFVAALRLGDPPIEVVLEDETSVALSAHLLQGDEGAIVEGRVREAIRTMPAGVPGGERAPVGVA